MSPSNKRNDTLSLQVLHLTVQRSQSVLGGVHFYVKLCAAVLGGGYSFREDCKNAKRKPFNYNSLGLGYNVKLITCFPPR